MAKNTAKLIKDTFAALLEERPLSEITVKEIVDNCGLNRNSFYYRSVCFGCVIGWLECGMDEEFAMKIRRIFVLKKDFASEFAGLLEGQI